MDLREQIPEIKNINKKKIDIDSINMTISDEILSEDNEISVNLFDVHN